MKTAVLPFIVPLQLRVTGDSIHSRNVVVAVKVLEKSKRLEFDHSFANKRLEFDKYFSQVGLRGTGWGHGDLGWGREQVDFDFHFNFNRMTLTLTG